MSEAHIYASSNPGFVFSYYDNTNFLSSPYIQRIENKIPGPNFSNEIKKFSYFTLRIESYLIFSGQSAGVVSDITFEVTIADSSSI